MAYIGNTVQTQGFAPAVDYFNGDGTTVTFTLSRPVASVAQLTAVIDNVIQNPSSAFTVAGNAITFTSAPLSGTNNIWVEYTSLVTTYAAISQDPSVIGDITATGGYLAEGDFGNSYIDGTIVDYVTGNARITTGPADGLTIYNGGTTARNALLTLNTVGAIGVGSSPSYGTAGQFLQSNGSSSAPTWVNAVYSTDYLIVAGGASGGASLAGGGGAGGYIASSALLVPGTAYAITIGAGGTATTGNVVGVNGSNSSFNGNTAIGGGGSSSYGVTNSYQANSGGSGGGGGVAENGAAGTGGAGTSGQGNAGGNGGNRGGTGNYPGAGGGGGAGAVGANSSGTTGGAGGVGLNWQSLGTYYAGGGGGSGYSGTGGAGGTGGGGAGGTGTTSPASDGVNGTANTGGGGGGSGNGTISGAGGSGVVIIRYAGSQKGTGGTVTSSGGYTYHTFTSSGTYTA